MTACKRSLLGCGGAHITNQEMNGIPFTAVQKKGKYIKKELCLFNGMLIKHLKAAPYTLPQEQYHAALFSASNKKARF